MRVSSVRKGMFSLALCVSVLSPVAAWSADPFHTSDLYAAEPGGRLLRGPCQPLPVAQALDLMQVVEQALCNNPQTRQAWVNARVQAAQVGVAQGAYLPSLSATAGRSRTFSDVAVRNQTTAGLTATYLLYDFGGREATLESARQLMAAMVATENATVQSVFLAAVDAYYQVLAAEAAVTAARESERASQESFKAADARYRAGSGTPADRLQAQTALAQASLARIQSEGNVQTALGALGNSMGLDAHRMPPLAKPEKLTPHDRFERNLGDLIEQAKRQRPDLAAAEAQVRAAEANIDVARASGLPTISLSAGHSYNSRGAVDGNRSNSIGISLSIPLFSGYSTTYRIRAAEAQRDLKMVQHDQLSKQVSLEVWRAYHALLTSTESVRAVDSLIASAEQSEKVAAGRYQAGVGSIIELLNAQSALASARQQLIQAHYRWYLAKATLAQAMGQLDFSAIPGRSTP